MLPTPRVHFVEKKELYKEIDSADNLWESGYWDVIERTADKLIGGHIYLHKAQKECSFHGGEIKHYYIQEQGKYKGRYVFVYEQKVDHEGINAGSEGWAREKKYVLD